MPASERSSEIQGVARLTFHEGKVEEFKRLCAEFIDIVRARDTGTLQFEIYLSDDESECVIYERYRDSEAVIDHGAHVGDVMPAIFGTGYRVPSRRAAFGLGTRYPVPGTAPHAKRKCITSPSRTTKSLPSRRMRPASRAPASPAKCT